MKKGVLGTVAVAAVIAVLSGHAQTLDLQGPSTMGRCEEETFTVYFSAGIQTASSILLTVTLPNAGFSYVLSSGLIRFPDGSSIPADPIPSGLDLLWDLEQILGETYELPAGETVTLEFRLGTGCGTVSGTLYARVDWEEEGTPRYLTDSQPIEILPGAVLIYKTPSVIEAEVGDTVTWTITVENTGFGPIYNVVVTDVLGSGLAYVSSDPPGNNLGQTVIWEFPKILAGEKVEIQLQAQVISCTGLENKADARFGCEDGSVCYDTAIQGRTATASIRLILKQPLLDWTPPTVQIPYCGDGVTVEMPITNIGEGPAYHVRLCMDCDPLVISDVGPGAYYQSGCFYIEDPILPGETFPLTFTVSVPEGWDWCAGVPSGTVICQTTYENVCGEEFRPPVKIGGFSTTYGPEGPPTLNVSLTGPGAVYICTVVDYNLGVSFSGLDTCGGGGTSDISVVVNVPSGFTVENPGGGTWIPGGDGTGGQINWTIPPTSPLSTTFSLRAPGTPRCGQAAMLTATATAQDCCGCQISTTRSIPIAIQCYQLVTASHQATPSTQQKCGEIVYTHTYVFTSDTGGLPQIFFGDLRFIEYAENAQAYVDGTLEVTIDGNPVPFSFINNTPGGPLIVQQIDNNQLVWGHTLVISYTLRLTSNSAPLSCPGSISFYTWTSLDLGPGCSTGDECTEPCQVTEVLLITSTTPSMSVSLSGLPIDFVDPCGTYTITLTLTKTSTYDPHDVVLRLENVNYYIVDLNSIQVSGVQPTSPIPTDYGTYYEWTYGEAFVGQPQGAQSVLTFQVRKRCGPGVELRAEAQYTDACGDTCSVSDTEAPVYLRSPNLIVYKTPEMVYATQNQITWTIYVVNSGNGFAYEVWVDDLLGSGLEYVSSSVTPATGVTTYPNQDHLGNPINGVSWHIAAMSPGEQRVITLTARMVACTDLWNEVVTSLGCGGEDCLPPVTDTSTVLVPSTQLAATSSTASPIATCSEQPALIRIRNTGDPAVYQLVVRETLPPGLEYVPGTTQWRKGSGSWSPGADPTITGDIGSGYTLEWTVTEIPGLAELGSREMLEIAFTFRALCNFEGGSFAVNVEYTNVCGEPGSLPVGTFRVDARRPSLSVNKVQISPTGPVDCGGRITWRIDVKNTSDVPIPYVWVEDVLGDSFAYVSSSGGIDGGYNSGALTTWVIENLQPGATTQLTLTAQHVLCGDLTNTLSAWWGCGSDADGSSATMDADCLTDTPVTTEITASRDPTVSLSPSVEPTQVPACGTAAFTLTIQNTSTATATAVDVRIALPSGLSYVSGSTEIDCGWGFSAAPDPVESGGYLYWYDPADPGNNLCDSVPPGETIRLRFQVQASCYTVARTVGIVVYYFDCCQENPFQTGIFFTIQPALPALSITKTPTNVPLDCYDPGDTVTWTITVRNTGAAQADWVRVEDTLGSSLEYLDSNPPATLMGANKYGWEFGPLAPGESVSLEITAYLTSPEEDCSAALRTNTARAWWGCGAFDGDPNTVEGCTGGGPVTATALVTIPDVYLNPTDIVPILTCLGDGDYTGRVQITIRNAGDAPVSQDFRLTMSETTTGWTVSGLFSADFGGTIPIPAGGSRTITIPDWPVTCGQCTYTFSVDLDTEDVLCECRENNNSATRTWTITLPDLTVRREALTIACAGDGQVRISGTVTLGNEGCGDPLMANIPMWFVLYDGSGCSGTVLHEWTETFTGVNIPAGGEQTFTVDHVFPLDLCTQATGCTVSLLIEADYTDSICECDGTNNTLCTDLAWDIPDLTVREENLSLACAGDGQVMISGTVTLGNEGCGNPLTANIPMRFVLYDGSDCIGTILHQWTETFTGANIPAGGEQTFNVTHTFPIDLCTQATECSVSLLIEADPTGAICECDGTNNALCTAFPVDIPDPAVVAVEPDVPDSCSHGQVVVTVANVGCVDSPAGVVVRISGGATGEATLPAIPAGDTATVTVDLNEVLPCGVHEIIATVDPDNQICECSSANNARAAQFTVVDPDLTFTELAVLCQGDGSFWVWATVQNRGTEASPAAAVRIYVDGGYFTTMDVPALAIGESYELAYETPRLKCGVEHHFRLVVDEADEICECNEGNNEIKTFSSCGCPALVTDKAIAAITRGGIPVDPSLPIQPGDVITYRLRVTNVGQGKAFDVDVRDEIPGEFLYILGSTSATWPSGSYSGDPSGTPGPSLFWDLSAELATNETLTLEFQVVVTSLVVPGQAYTNTMWATGVEGNGTPIPPDMSPTIPGDNDPDDSSSVSHMAVAVPALSVDKRIVDVIRGGVSIWPTEAVEPGDLIHYRFIIRNIGQGTAYDVNFTDELPEGLEYDTDYADGMYWVDQPRSSGSLGIPDGATGHLVADISAIIDGGGTLVADFYAYVTSAVRQGVDHRNYATATGKDGYGTPIPPENAQAGDAADDDPDDPDPDDTGLAIIAVREPALALTKEIIDVLRGGVSIWPTPVVLWGDVIVYRVTVRNVGLGTAYDVDFSDQLPFGLAYDTIYGDGTYTVDNPPASGSLGIPDGATGTITADISVTIGGGGTLVAVYRARVTPEAVPGSWLTNIAMVAGVDGAGTPIPEFNQDVSDTYQDQDSTTIRVGIPALVTHKAYYCPPCDPCAPEPVACNPCPEEPIEVQVGEVVRFQLTVTNVGYSTAYDIVIEDRLPKGFEYVKESAVLTGPGGAVQLEPVLGDDALLTWITGLSLEPGESLSLLFSARVTESAPVGEEVANVMRAEGVDAFNVPIPADSSMFVPEDTDLHDTSTLRLRILPGSGATLEDKNLPRRLAGIALLGATGLGMFVGYLRRSRFLGLGAFLLILGFGLVALPGEMRYTVELVSDPPRAGVVFGAGTYQAGELVQVSALPEAGFEFVGWFEDEEKLSTSPFFEFEASRNRRLVARFRAVLELAGISGASQGKLSLLPSISLESWRVEVRPRWRFGFNRWDMRALVGFAGEEWRDAQVHFTGSWDKVRLGGGLMFTPTGPSYRSAYVMLSFPWDDLRLGLRVTHYPTYGTPPRPALLSNLTLSLPNQSLTVRFEEKGVLTLKDVTFSLFGLELCCDLTLQGTLVWTKQGFSYLRLLLVNIPLNCCALLVDINVTFGVDEKSVEFAPRWSSYCDACLTVYGDVLWDSKTYAFQGLALYGYKVRCCFGPGCCPPTGGYVEFLTAFDPSRVPGGFLADEFEYLRAVFCGPACCGGTYTVDLSVFFSRTGGLLGLSRFLVAASTPVASGLKIQPKLELRVSGTAGFSLSWDWRF